MCVAVAFAAATAVASAQSAYSDVCEPYFSERYIFNRLALAERKLRVGGHKDALRIVRPLADQLFSCHRLGDQYNGVDLHDRAMYVAATALIRISGDASWFYRGTHEQKLKFALGWIRRAAKEGDPNGWSRYGEALVARGDEESLHEAYGLLSRLHAEDKILEPEGYAALTRAARGVGDDEMAAAAQKQCRKLAPGRARRTCPAIGDRR